MRLIIFTNRDLASNYHLNLVLPKIADRTVRIFVSDKVGGKPAAEPPKALLDLKFFEQILPNEILFPRLESQERDFQGKLLTFNELSKKYNIPIQSLNDVKSEESLDIVRDLAPDLVVSVRYGKIFGNAFIQIPRLGVINLHSGLLPEYRGVLATFRALLNGDDEIGCTLHYIDDGQIDKGGIIGFYKTPVDRNKSLLEHILALYPGGADMIADAVYKIEKGIPPTLTQQDESRAAYFSFPTPTDIDAFTRMGLSFVDTAFYAGFLKKYL